MADLDRTSLATGLLALTGAGLYLLDATAAVEVDEAVTGASLLVALGLAGLIRSVQKLLSRG